MESIPKSEQAAVYSRQGFNCSQSVLLAFAQELGLAPEAAMRVASGFGGGLGRTGSVCGAVTGGAMVVGLLYGSTDPLDKAAKENTYALVSEFVRRFKERFGATGCTELLGIDLRDPEGQRNAREAGLFRERCPLFIQGAAAILEEMRNQN